MQRLLTVFFCAALFFTACQNSGNDNKKTESEITDSTKFTTIFWQDSIVNFGSRKMGDVVEVTFNCTNTGTKPLYLYDVRPGCGCTLVDYSRAPIKPGDQGKIEARFDTKKAHVGEVHKVVYVHSNTAKQIPYLSFTGTVTAATKN